MDTFAKAAKVILIDDDEFLLDSYSAALIDENYNCICKTSAEDALRYIEDNPDSAVILSDIQMPGISGIELLRIIRERYPERVWLQTVLVTGYPTMENSIDALRLEAVDFLAKPVRRDQLLAVVETAVKRSNTKRQDTATAAKGRTILRRLIEHAQHLNQVYHSVRADPRRESEVPGTIGQSERCIAVAPLTTERMLDLLSIRHAHAKYFADKMFGDPTLFMLLKLMECHLRESKCSVSSLYAISGVSKATTTRRIEDLERSEFVLRVADPNDARRHFVFLTDKAVGIITSYLQHLDQFFSKPMTMVHDELPARITYC